MPLMAAAGASAIDAWLGTGVDRLHPALRRLHAIGGRLEGDVDVQVADTFVGRRLAHRTGLRPGASRVRMRVDVVSGPDGLLWTRRFDDGPLFVSRFQPQGRWPEGAWRETSGRLAVELGVDLADGGWRWVQRRARFAGVVLPDALAPQIRGDKRIVDGRYRFTVALALPTVGTVLRYGGDLSIHAAD